MKPTLIAPGTFLAAALLLPAGMTGAAAADNPTLRLKTIEQELRQTQNRHSALNRHADDMAAEVTTLKQRMVRAAGEAQRHEAEMTRLEGRTLDLSARIGAANESWAKKREQMIALLAALERVAQHPPIAIAARPGDPVDTLRTALLIRAAVPALLHRSTALRREVKELAGLRTELTRQRTRLQVAKKALTAKRGELSRLIGIKTRIEHATRAESAAADARAMALAGEAKDLKELLVRLEADRREQKSRDQRRLADRHRQERKRLERERAEAMRQRLERQLAARTAETGDVKRDAIQEPPSTAGSQTTGGNRAVTLSVATLATAAPRTLALPAQGRLIRRFGERIGFGTGAKGLSISTRQAAQVVAPRGGEVVFAGAFRRYGQLLIIRHDDGYHVLLSGMARIDAVVGDRVLAGEPVGAMDSDSSTQPTLYVELRRNGQPINPMPWLSASRSKVNG